MTLTSQSDLYGAVHEEGINQIVRNVMRQRPSLFNYGTAMVRANPKLLCSPIDASPDVSVLITPLPRLPLFPTGAIDLGPLSEYGIDLSMAGSLALDYAVQLTTLQVDLHPGNVFVLPPELGPPLNPQQLAFRSRVCGGLSCIPKKVLKKFPMKYHLGNSGMVRYAGQKTARKLQYEESAGRYSTRKYTASQTSAIQAGAAASSVQAQVQATALTSGFPGLLSPLMPIDKLECFCMELFATANSEFAGQAGNQQLNLDLDGIELKNLTPAGLEKSIECYLRILMDRVVLPQLSDVVSETVFKTLELPALYENGASLGSIKFSAATAPAHNPAVEDNQLKLFVNLDELAITLPEIVIEGDDGAPPAPEPVRTERSRTRTGPAHLTAAVSEAAFQRVFGIIRDTGKFRIRVNPRTMSIWGVSGTASARVEFHLENGTVSFEPDNTIRIRELDIKWEKLEVSVAIDLPTITFYAPVPVPWPPFVMIVEVGELFEDSTDIAFTLNFPTEFTTEVSCNAGFKTYYGVGPSNEWQVYITPSRVDVDIIDIADTVADMLNNALDEAANDLGIPSEIVDLIEGIIELVRDGLDIADDLFDWIQTLIFDSLGIETNIETYVAVWLADKIPIYRLVDPIPVMAADGSLIAVNLPIEYIEARIDDREMTLHVDVGG